MEPKGVNMDRAFYLWTILQQGITRANVELNWELQDLLKQMTPDQKAEAATWSLQ